MQSHPVPVAGSKNIAIVSIKLTSPGQVSEDATAHLARRTVSISLLVFFFFFATGSLHRPEGEAALS